MENYQISFIVYIAGVFIASLSQILLKISANKTYSSKIKEYLNIYVISAYGMLFCTTFATIWALKTIDISVGSILETLGYVFVAILSRFILKEKFSVKSKLGYVFIVAGVILFEVL